MCVLGFVSGANVWLIGDVANHADAIRGCCSGPEARVGATQTVVQGRMVHFRVFVLFA